ncbi:sigma 54-interacting transcriptional regulator, partial [Candidatus Methylomirabilis sp.]|uniref:sigma-54-dependent transcriptional regulator n=1 Tax=Candidatus Methylomirabilis sp. TaxID=2032687 RepID=UPI003C773828
GHEKGAFTGATSVKQGLFEVAGSGEEALEQLRAREFDVVLLDLKMPGIGGMEALRRIRESGTSAEVVILTGHPDVDSAINAMKLGAYDYLTKPFKLSELEEVLRRAAERKRLREENTALRRMVAQREPAPIMIGQSPAIASLLATVRRIAPSEASVLIQGESGTGKSLVAKAIHAASPRASGPFLIINCSGFQDPLLESELFGHEKGAFTGATSVKQGLFEVAGSGTLLLDEVGEMSPAMQAKLLQVLDTKELRRVGGTRVHRADVRIIAATNKDLAQEVRTGRFREDLYYRLNVVSLTLPSLRERKEDIPLLIEHFLRQFRVTGQKAKTVFPEAMPLLADYPWPGNVRELANTIERLLILSSGDVISLEDLPPNIRFPSGLTGGPASLVEMERLHLIRVLDHTGGKKMQAARLLGIDLKTLNSKIKRYNIPL